MINYIDLIVSGIGLTVLFFVSIKNISFTKRIHTTLERLEITVNEIDRKQNLLIIEFRDNVKDFHDRLETVSTLFENRIIEVDSFVDFNG